MLKVENLEFSYEGSKYVLLKNINFEIAKNELIALIGKSGCGKTTLFKLLLGVLNQSKGKISVFNKIYNDDVNLREVWKRIGYFHQEPLSQIITNSVEDEIRFALENFDFSEDEIKRRIDYVIKIFELEDIKEMVPSILSAGEVTRTILASIFALEPDLFILDEPTSYLDYYWKERFMKLLKEYCSEKKASAIYTTEFIDEVIWADRVFVLHAGKIIDFVKKDFLRDYSPLLNLLDDYSKFTDYIDKKNLPSIERIIEEIIKE